MRRFLISSARFSWFGRRPEHLVAMLDQFDRLPADTPNRAAIAALLVRTTVISEMFTALADRVERLITIVDEAARQPATWATIRPVARAACLLAFLEQGTTTAVEEVMSELDQLAHQVDTNHPHAAMMTMIHLGAKQMRSRFDGDIVGVSKVTDDVKSLHEDLLKRGKPEARVAELMAAAHDAAQSCLYGDLPAMDAALGRTTELRRRLPKADDARTWAYVDEGLRNLHAMRAFMDADSPDRINAPALQQYAAGLRRGAGRRGISATAHAAFRVQLAGLGVLKSFDDGSDGSVEIDVAIGDLRAAVAATPQLDPRYVYVLMTLGAALVRRSELCASPRDLTEGIELLEQAKDHAGDPANQYWAPLCMMLGWAHRQAGRNEMANQIAHGGLRGHLAKVLLQSRTGAATAAARAVAVKSTETVDLIGLAVERVG